MYSDVLRAAGYQMGYHEPTYHLCIEECHGKCCRAPGYVVLTLKEMRALKELGPFKVLSHVDRPGLWVIDFSFQKEKRCPFLDDATSLCSVYWFRPQGCRVFPQRPMEGCLAWGLNGGVNGTSVRV